MESTSIWYSNVLITCSASKWVSLVAQMVKNPSSMQETWVQSLGQEDPLEKEMAIHSSIFAWETSWTEDPGRLQSMGSQKSWTWLSDQTTITMVQDKYKNKEYFYMRVKDTFFPSDSKGHLQSEPQCRETLGNPVAKEHFWLSWHAVPLSYRGFTEALLISLSKWKQSHFTFVWPTFSNL